MFVMMIAITPSLKALIRSVFIPLQPPFPVQ